MKRIVKISGIVVSVIFVLTVIYLYIYIVTYVFPSFAPRWITQLPPNPPSPAIKYGEFPFKIVYEIDGEMKTVEDTLICEFDGFIVNQIGGNKEREWKSHLASGNTRITLNIVDGIEIFFTPGINSREIAAVYMGDTEKYHNDINSSFPNAWYTTDFENKQVNSYIISADKMWEQYKIRILSWEPSSPIQNSFE